MTNDYPAPEQRVRDFLDVSEEGGDLIAYAAGGELTISDLNDVLNELDAARQRITDLEAIWKDPNVDPEVIIYHATDIAVDRESDTSGAWVYIHLTDPDSEDDEPHASISLSDEEAFNLHAELRYHAWRARAQYHADTKGV